MDRLLFLDNSIPDDLYHPLYFWQPLLLLPFDVCRVCTDELPTQTDAYSHIFISGSTASVLEDSDWMRAEMQLIRAAVDRGRVILGSCFGHQIIARALFGSRAVRSRPAPEIGWPDIEIIADDALLGAAGRTINGFLFHFDEVCDLPPDRATVLARSATCENLAFKIKDKPVWGLQPHLEIGIVEALKFLDLVQGEGIPERKSFFGAPENFPKDSGRIIALMKAFQQTRPGAV
jgi:GMP synthase-like glutamine amidotransferase